MVVFDEADELINNVSYHKSYDLLIKEFTKWGIVPQYLFFSATVNEEAIQRIKLLIKDEGRLKCFTVKKESLRLKGVKQFKLKIDEKKKKDFLI
jgi:superfamily II DNA/RNA helicase